MILLIYFLTAIGLTTGDSSTICIYAQTMHRKKTINNFGNTVNNFEKKVTALNVGRLSGIRTQSGQSKINVELTA